MGNSRISHVPACEKKKAICGVKGITYQAYIKVNDVQVERMASGWELTNQSHFFLFNFSSFFSTSKTGINLETLYVHFLWKPCHK